VSPPNDVFWVDADIGASWSSVTDEVVWHDLATDGRRIYAAGYASEVLMGGVLRRTIVMAAYELDGSVAWRHELGVGTNTGEARAVEVDPTDGTIWFGGQLERDVSLGAASLTEIGGSDAFLLAVSPAGDGLRGWVFGGEGHDAVDALALGSEGPIAAGQAEGAVDLGGGPVMAGDRDQSIFVASFTRSGAHTHSTLYTLTDGDGIEVEDLDAAPGNRVVLIGHLNDVVEVSFGGAPLTNVDGSFVLEIGPDGGHLRSWAAPARARLGGVVALDDSAILFGSFQGRMSLGGEERVSFGTALSERCIATPTDPECALLDGGAWVGWSDSFLVRMRDPETVDWFVQHHGTTPVALPTTSSPTRTVESCSPPMRVTSTSAAPRETRRPYARCSMAACRGSGPARSRPVRWFRIRVGSSSVTRPANKAAPARAAPAPSRSCHWHREPGATDARARSSSTTRRVRVSPPSLDHSGSRRAPIDLRAEVLGASYVSRQIESSTTAAPASERPRASSTNRRPATATPRSLMQA
jgi:hypothetical protein